MARMHSFDCNRRDDERPSFVDDIDCNQLLIAGEDRTVQMGIDLISAADALALAAYPAALITMQHQRRMPIRLPAGWAAEPSFPSPDWDSGTARRNSWDTSDTLRSAADPAKAGISPERC